MQEDTRDCLLYLVSPEKLDAKAFSPQLFAALKAGEGRIAGFLLHLPDADDDALVAASEILMPVCSANTVAFFLQDRPDLVAWLGADGVHLVHSRKSIADVRAVVGKDTVIGVAAADGDHAMEAGNAGADYVAFDSTKTDLIDWWQECFVLPSLALGDHAPEDVKTSVAAGADFIAASASIWNHPQGAGEAVKQFVAALTEALPSA